MVHVHVLAAIEVLDHTVPPYMEEGAGLWFYECKVAR